jgi:hypothetical protein
MALVRAAVAFFSDIANFFCNSKMPLLLRGCLFCNSRFPAIFAYFEKTDIIIDSIDAVEKGIFFSVSLISKAANCGPDIMTEYLAILDKLAEASFGLGVLCFDRVSKLLKQRRSITRQCFVMFS